MQTSWPSFTAPPRGSSAEQRAYGDPGTAINQIAEYPDASGAAEQTAGYTGVVSLEAWASTDSRIALERFRQAFTRPDLPRPRRRADVPPGARSLQPCREE
jgi:hypothetical protein